MGHHKQLSIMAGYNYNKMMSNNAVKDVAKGIVPAYELPVPLALIAKYLGADNWHHVGSEYYWTPFVRAEKVLAFFGLIQSDDYPTSETAAKEYIGSLSETERMKVMLFNPSIFSTGTVTSDYPYDIDGQWRWSEEFRVATGLPSTDEVIEDGEIVASFRYRRGTTSRERSVKIQKIKVQRLTSGYYRFGFFVRHPSQLPDAKIVWSRDKLANQRGKQKVEKVEKKATSIEN